MAVNPWKVESTQEEIGNPISIEKEPSNIGSELKKVHNEIQGSYFVQVFRCSQCEEGFTTFQSLNTHIESVHGGKNPYKCFQCDDSFKQSKELLNHIASVHEEKKHLKCS